jgi:hypothetical protein
VKTHRTWDQLASAIHNRDQRWRDQEGLKPLVRQVSARALTLMSADFLSEELAGKSPAPRFCIYFPKVSAADPGEDASIVGRLLSQEIGYATEVTVRAVPQGHNEPDVLEIFIVVNLRGGKSGGGFRLRSDRTAQLHSLLTVLLTELDALVSRGIEK